jgi:hypothetical protein
LYINPIRISSAVQNNKRKVETSALGVYPKRRTENESNFRDFRLAFCGKGT